MKKSRNKRKIWIGVGACVLILLLTGGIFVLNRNFISRKKAREQIDDNYRRGFLVGICSGIGYVFNNQQLTTEIIEDCIKSVRDSIGNETEAI